MIGGLYMYLVQNTKVFRMVINRHGYADTVSCLPESKLSCGGRLFVESGSVILYEVPPIVDVDASSMKNGVGPGEGVQGLVCVKLPGGSGGDSEGNRLYMGIMGMRHHRGKDVCGERRRRRTERIKLGGSWKMLPKTCRPRASPRVPRLQSLTLAKS